MKSLTAPGKSTRKLRASKWVPDGLAAAAVTRAAADRFTDGLLKIAARIEGLPSDLARNHDHYLHGLPKK